MLKRKGLQSFYLKGISFLVGIKVYKTIFMYPWKYESLHSQNIHLSSCSSKAISRVNQVREHSSHGSPYISQICIKSNLQNYNPGQKYLAIFLKNAHFQFPYYSSWKAKRAKIVTVPESADILPVGVAMFVDLGTKILNLSLIDKYHN